VVNRGLKVCECNFDSWLKESIRPRLEEKQRKLAQEIDDGDFVTLNSSNSQLGGLYQTIVTFSGIEATRHIIAPSRK